MARPQSEEEVLKNYGSPLKYDPNFTGPRKKRSCTDIICLLLFAVFLGIWVAIGIFAFARGDPHKLVMAVDSTGRKCGVDSEVADKPYLFFFDISKCATPAVLINGCPTPQVCVRECPQTTWSSTDILNGNVQFNRQELQDKLICVNDNIKKSINTLSDLKQRINDNSCASFYISSKAIQRRCLPIQTEVYSSRALILKSDRSGRANIIEQINNSTIILGSVNSLNEFGTQVLEDLLASWKYILVLVIFSILVSIVYIVLIRWIAGIVTWISLIAIVALFAAAAAFSYLRFDHIRKYGPDESSNKMLRGLLDQVANSKEFFLALCIICGIFAIVMLLLIIFLRKRIAIAIALIEEGSKAVGSVITALFFPIFPTVLQCIVIVWAIVLSLFLFSVGDPTYKVNGLASSDCVCRGDYTDIKDGDLCDASMFSQFCSQRGSGGACTTAGCHFYAHNSPSYVIYLHLTNLFGFFWGIWFMSGLSQMILAATFATWYWTFNKRNVPFWTVGEASFRTIRYHLGTIAFGSLIISICSFIRAMIEYAESKLKKYDNGCVKAVFCCLKCCFWCLENFLKFINRNAYIMCAIHGKNFCTSAKDAFNLLMRNVLRVVVLDKVTDYLFFVGKLVITGIMVGISYVVINKEISNDLHYVWVPTATIGVASFIIASIFFGVYAMAVDTIFLCFLEDCERNDGTPEKPYYMSKNLMKILGKRNKRV